LHYQATGRDRKEYDMKRLMVVLALASIIVGGAFAQNIVRVRQR
jgi:hypothetical protein